MAPTRIIKHIVVHCSATRPSMDIGAKEIDKWHKARGWMKIGYHYVIRRNGEREAGRKEHEIGAHVEGHNSHSIGVCWVGGVDDDNYGPQDNRTPEQKQSLAKLIAELKIRYPDAEVLGHRDFPGVTKACPCFDAREEYK